MLVYEVYEVAGEVEVSRTVGVGVGPMEGERQTRKGKGCTAESSIFHLLAATQIIYHREVLATINIYRACLPDNHDKLSFKCSCYSG